MLKDTEEQLLVVCRRWPLDGQQGRRLIEYGGLGLSETRAVQVVNACSRMSGRGATIRSPSRVCGGYVTRG